VAFFSVYVVVTCAVLVVTAAVAFTLRRVHRMPPRVACVLVASVGVVWPLLLLALIEIAALGAVGGLPSLLRVAGRWRRGGRPDSDDAPEPHEAASDGDASRSPLVQPAGALLPVASVEPVQCWARVGRKAAREGADAIVLGLHGPQPCPFGYLCTAASQLGVVNRAHAWREHVDRATPIADHLNTAAVRYDALVGSICPAVDLVVSQTAANTTDPSTIGTLFEVASRDVRVRSAPSQHHQRLWVPRLPAGRDFRPLSAEPSADHAGDSRLPRAATIAEEGCVHG